MNATDSKTPPSKGMKVPTDLEGHISAICWHYRKNETLRADLVQQVANLRKAIDRQVADYQTSVSSKAA